MADTDFDVIIAAYLIPDLAQDDFDAMVKLVADKRLEGEAIALVAIATDGAPTVQQTGDHLGRKGMTIGGGVGLVVCLFAPPLLASVVVGGAAGALVGRFAKHKVESGLGEKLGAALPPGTAGLIAIYHRTKADLVDRDSRQRGEEVSGRGRRRRRETAESRAGRSAGGNGRRLTTPTIGTAPHGTHSARCR